MGSKVCMNGLCGATYSHGKKGWPLRSGGFAILCHNCWTLYEQLAFCDMFHSDDSGWRECISCGKRLHCGCVASSSLLEILDINGVICIRCVKGSGVQPKGFESPTEFGSSMEKYVGETLSASIDNQINGDNIHNMDFKQFANLADGNGPKQFLPRQDDNIVSSHCQMTQEGSIPPSADTGNTCFSNFGQLSAGSSHNAETKVSEDKENSDVKDVYGSPVQTNLTISLATPSLIQHSSPTAVCEVIKSIRTVSSFQPGSRSHHLLPKGSQPDVTEKLDPNASTVSPIRVARPPVEGRIKNQLLPRYWPRITEQELQKISGDSNSTIIPLFEKILSASDAGRIGRLVLPKACAEAYFPPISQPEGIPVRIQDVKGEEWVFQFRFWPNNNSRMYVLEGVTPCIQSMQLQAGDTVTFSRMDPEGKLLMGFRKASNNLMQNTHFSGKHNGSFASEPFLSGVIENLPTMSGYSGLLQSMSGGTDPHLKVFSKNLSSSSGDVSWHVTDEPGGKRMIDSLLAPERKKSRNIGLKRKRLLIDNKDALELKLTWEEVQEMLHPPASVQPTSVTVEDHEFEEYDAPPVLGKRSIFTARSSGKQEQWTTCDDCSKWRRLPADFLLPPVWRCQENVWDRSRCSCAAPDELSPWELEKLFKLNNDFKRRRITVFNQMSTHNHDSNSRGVLASSTVQGDVNDLGATEVATTTKHPRHRPGCSCIVCIQPPSGKGKHKPTCTCNVCTTVKRRFKTLLLRKKKRQTEREAEIAQRNQFIWGPKEEVEVDSTSQGRRLVDPSENRSRSGNEAHANDQRNDQADRVTNANADKLDLNCQPNSTEDLPIKSTRISMMSLVQVATRPLEIYLKQNGLASLISEQQTSSVSHALPQATTESEGQPRQDQSLVLVAQEEEPESDDKLSEPIQIGTDLS